MNTHLQVIARVVIVLLWLLIGCHSRSFAQGDSSDGLRAGPLPVMSAARPLSARAIEEELGNLIDATKRVGEQIRSPATSARQTETGYHAKLIDQPAVSAAPNKTAGQIRERIKLLRRLRDRSEASPSNQNLSEAHVNDRVITPDSVQILPEKQPTLSAIENNLAESTPPTENVVSASEPTINARKILSGPVSHLALGQSLYRTKNYSAARKALQQVDSRELPESDRAWLELLLALCHRRLGDLDTAEASLRELANAKSTDYPVSVARYWLNQSKVIRESKNLAESSAGAMNALIERSKTYDGQ